jgi:hypothetical protein
LRALGDASTRQLDVYVAPDCFGCTEARRLASEVARRYPHVVVRVVDLEARLTTPNRPLTPAEVPVDVVAVPTYVLDGRVIALGNPAPEHLFARLGQGSVTGAGSG